MLSELTTSDIVQIIGIISTGITSIIAIVISVIAIKQSSKSLEEATRPYISAYVSSTQFGQPIAYIVLKNFGNTSAVISDFKCNVDLSKHTYNPNAIPFDKINGLSLSPRQKIIYPINLRDENKELLEKIKISYTYSDSNKKYSEDITLNISEYCNSINLRSYEEKTPMRSIAYSIQDIAEKML